MSDIKMIPYTTKLHADLQDNSVLTCACCGAGIVQHIGVQDGWRAGVGPGGLAWVCSKDICQKMAGENGITVVGRGR